jgi:hypothetical protein
LIAPISQHLIFTSSSCFYLTVSVVGLNLGLENVGENAQVGMMVARDGIEPPLTIDGL